MNIFSYRRYPMFLQKLMFWKKKYDFYLCGAMRGHKDLNGPLFTLIADLLRNSGFTVWSPAEHKSYLKVPFAECMTTDLDAVVNKCRSIAFLPGWEKSQGANGEAFAAFLCGKKAVEVILNEDATAFVLAHIDLSGYRLPYGDATPFDPHQL